MIFGATFFMRNTYITNVQPTDFLGGSDAEVIELSEDEKTDIDDRPPHLVFLISGIRSDGMWAEHIIESQFNAEGREIEFRSIRGNIKSSTGRLHSGHLVTRLGLKGFRENIIQNIDIWSERFPESPISIFAHSMGSSLFAEAIPDIREALSKRGLTLNVIAFLGSICHRKHSPAIFDFCDKFINDVGVNDMWPWRASTILPFCYSDVGLLSFGDGRPLERRFLNDHTSCTSQEHVEQYLLPFLSDNAPRSQGVHIGARPKRSYNTYSYVRHGVHAGIIAWAMSLIYMLIALPFWVAILVSAGFMTLIISAIILFK